MTDSTTTNLEPRFSRRRALAVGGGAAAGALIASVPGAAQAAQGACHGKKDLLKQSGKPPLKALEKILEIEGEISEGLADFAIDREDAKSVAGPLGVTFTGSFEIDGSLYFQPLRDGKLAFLNGDVPLKPQELNPFIDALLANGLTFQAMHQHYFDLRPMYWFIHFRGVGEPLALARSIKAALGVTAIPFPQKGPAHPKTSFDTKRLAKILHGTPTVGDEGVVTVSVSRKHPLAIAGVEVNPDANLSTEIEFKPHGMKGMAAVGPDFSMTAHEVMPVIRTMRGSGWQVHCLYNQETAEHPQLYFSHMIKTGDPYALAQEIRAGLDHTDAD